MTQTDTIVGINAILAVLTEREEAKTRSNPEDNPFIHHDLKALSHGLPKGADNIPAVNMAAQAPDMELAFDLERARFETAAEGKADKSAKRMAEARRRAERKVAYDKIVVSKKVPSKARMSEAWVVVVHLLTIIDRIAKSKQRWATRYLGSNADDIPSMAAEQIALVVAKQTKWEIAVLTEAAEQLGRSNSGIPGAQTWHEDEPRRDKQVKKARKWLMGMVYNRIMGALVDSYTNANNLRWENLDLITTVMASIGGVGEDPLGAKFKTERTPMFMGARFQKPGGIDPHVLATAISAAITEKGLDALAEFILNDDHRRTDGAVMWSKHAEAIFRLTPGGLGDWMWDQVVLATANHARATNARGEAAMNHVRNLFEWLPGVVVEIVRSLQPQTIGWSAKSRLPVHEAYEKPVPTVETIHLNLGSGVVPSPHADFDGTTRPNAEGEEVFWPATVGQPVGNEQIERVQMIWHHRRRHTQQVVKGYAVLASNFELFYVTDHERLPLQPALRYPTIQEAAEVLAHAMTGEVIA